MWRWKKLSVLRRREKKGNYNVGAGDQQLSPLGKRLSAAERNTMMQHVPRRPNSGLAICLDYNAHSGSVRGATCKFAHDFIGGKICTGVSRRKSLEEVDFGNAKR